MTRQVATYCRICPATCGLLVDIEDTPDGARVAKAAGDGANPLTDGFTCTKGRHIGDLMHAPNRLVDALRRGADGAHEPLPVEQAIGEIAARLNDVIATDGPDSVALFTGTQAAMASLTLPFTHAFWRSIGSRSTFSSMTVDQSAKWITEGRLGMWAAGGQRLADADVWMFLGTNPVVSMQGGYFTGFPIHDGLRRIKAERSRGLQMIVVDPRRTELAANADLHLQIVPGTDAVLVAGILRQVLANDDADADFVDTWSEGIDSLRAGVDRFPPERVADVCGIPVADVVRAAAIFGGAQRGMATAGTGPDMGPHANLAEHLVQALNVVCGRFPRAGDELSSTAVLGSVKPLPAQVIAPNRTWEREASPVSGYGPLHNELPSVTLADEINAGRVKALIVSGANPAGAIPDSERMAAALDKLELLVTVDPFMSATAEHADYVIAPKMHLERPDTTRAYEGLMDRPFAQYTPAVVDAPPGTIDDWEFFLRLALALGANVKVAGREYGPDDAIPTTDDVLAGLAGRGQVTLDELRQYPHGAIFDAVEKGRVTEPLPGEAARFALAPTDVAAELAALDESAIVADPSVLLLAVRRLKNVINSTGTQISALSPAVPNPCFIHPDDLDRLGLDDDDAVVVRTAHGAVDAVVRGDRTLRPGVASLSHGWGGRGADGLPSGTNLNALLSATADLQPLSGMPLLTAVPITIERR